MPLRLMKPAILGAIIALAPLAPATAEETAPVDRVVATVNGTDITLGHMIVLRAGLPAQYDQVPAQVLFDGILDQLVQQTLLAQSHEGDPSRQARLIIENEERAVMASEVLSGVIDSAISDDTIQAAYEARYAGTESEVEYSAAHILVATEEEAADLIAKIEEGAEFPDLAREFSTGPSGPNGGDLGWFGEGVMVAPFFEAVAALEPGQISAPVQTDFGWHVIQLKETRAKERPELDAVRGDIAEFLRAEAVEAHVATLETGADIERADLSDVDLEMLNDASLLEN